MTYTLSNDPDDWDEAEWIRRVTRHIERYDLPPGVEVRVIEAVNADVVTIGPDGEFIPIDHEVMHLALWEAELREGRA